MGGGVVLTQITDQLWLIGDESIALPAGVDVCDFLIAQALRGAGGLVPLPVEVRGMGTILQLVVLPDGSVTNGSGGALTPTVLRWLRPAGSLSSEFGAAPVGPAPVPLRMFGTHPGAGLTTWAQLLGGAAAGSVDEKTLLVTRTTLAGVESAKAYTATAAAVLLVADAPGSVPRDVARSIRVLEGAIPAVRAPWVPALRGMVSVPPGTEKSKAVAKVATALSQLRRKA
jgi:hypothetical protein